MVVSNWRKLLERRPVSDPSDQPRPSKTFAIILARIMPLHVQTTSMPPVLTLIEVAPDEIRDNPYIDPKPEPNDEGSRTRRSQHRILTIERVARPNCG
jgi:hypothetical protein